MVPLHTVSIRLQGKPTLGEGLRLVWDALGPCDEFFVQGFTSNSATAPRVRKNLPALTPYCGQYDQVSRLLERWTWSHPEVTVFETTSLPMPPAAPLFELADGAPRRYPCETAMFVWRSLPWLTPDCALPPPQTDRTIGEPMYYYSDPEPLIALWRQHNGRCAVGGWVPARIGDGAKRPPKLPAQVAQTLSRIGKVSDQGLRARWSKEEQDANRSAERAAREEFVSLLAAPLALPHDLSNASCSSDLSPLSRDHSSDAARVLAPLGYKALSAAGFTGRIVWARTTAHNNRAEIHIDFGTRARRISVGFDLVGLGWRLHADLPFSTDLHQGTYGVPNDDVYAQIMDNVGIVVAELVPRLITTAERHVAPTPPYWKLPAKQTQARRPSALSPSG